MTTVFTIGYEGSSIEAFTAELLAAGVKTLADVRALPLSRKKGFSKNALKQTLEAIGIDYLHFPQLGDPKPGRDAARAGRHAEFRQVFLAHFNAKAPQQATIELARVAKSSATCLMCFEGDHRFCHRSIIVDQLITYGMTVVNLTPAQGSTHGRRAPKGSRGNSREGFATAQQDLR